MANTLIKDPVVAEKLKQLDNDTIFLLEEKYSHANSIKKIEAELVKVEEERVQLLRENKLPWWYRLWQ